MESSSSTEEPDRGIDLSIPHTERTAHEPRENVSSHFRRPDLIFPSRTDSPGLPYSENRENR